MSYARMVEAEPKPAAEVAGRLQAASRIDRVEDRAHGAERRGDETPDWVASKERRLARLREAEAQARRARRSATSPIPGAGS